MLLLGAMYLPISLIHSEAFSQLSHFLSATFYHMGPRVTAMYKGCRPSHRGLLSSGALDIMHLSSSKSAPSGPNIVPPQAPGTHRSGCRSQNEGWLPNFWNWGIFFIFEMHYVGSSRAEEWSVRDRVITLCCTQGGGVSMKCGNQESWKLWEAIWLTHGIWG